MTPWVDLFVQGLVQGLGFWTAGLVVVAIAATVCLSVALRAIARGPKTRTRR